MNSFTVTQVKLAFECPRLFWLGHHYAVKTLFIPPTASVGIGVAFHQLAANMVDAATQDQGIQDLFTAPRDELDAVMLGDAVQRRLYDLVFFPRLEQIMREQPEQATGLLQMWQGATRLIRRWTDLLLANRRHCPAKDLFASTFIGRELPVQHDFTLSNGATCRVSGKLDSLVYHFERQRLEVVDFKTFAPLDGTAGLVQTALYGYMLNRSKGVPVDSAVYSVLPEWQEYVYPWERLEETIHALLPGRLQQMVDWLAWQPESSGSNPPPVAAQNKFCEFCLHNNQCNEVFSHLVVAETTPNTEAYLHIGHGPNGQWLNLPPNILRTHIAVVGAAGSGKTWMAKVIAEEAVRNGIPVIAVDPQGDLVQFLQTAVAEAIPAAYQGDYQAFIDHREVRVFTPGSSHAERQCLNPLRLPNSADLARIADPQRREEERGNLLASVTSNLVNLAGIGGEVAAQHSVLYRLIDLYCQQADTALELAHLAELLLDPARIGLDNPEALIKKSEREKLARRFNTFVVGPAANLFQGGQPLDIAALTQPTPKGKTRLNVIYLNALTDDGQKHFYVATLATEIYRWMITSSEKRLSLNFREP